jgi:putative copper export protein
MALVDTAMYVLHLLFAGVWTGSVLLVSYAVLPTARDGDIDPGPLAAVTKRFSHLSRASILVLLVTGGHLAGSLYTVESLTGSTRGYLVLVMLALWFVLAGLTEMGAARLRDGTDESKVRTPERAARPFFYAGSVVAVLLLVVGGLLAAGVA